LEATPEERESLQQKFRKSVAGVLSERKSEINKTNREMTCAVMSRWYRAPEVILTEKSYGKGGDIWSIGCILIELLISTKEFVGKEDRYLFQGMSCFPISPKSPSAEDADYEMDQLVKIIHRFKKRI
jgi:serine/threonine protein kinase